MFVKQYKISSFQSCFAVAKEAFLRLSWRDIIGKSFPPPPKKRKDILEVYIPDLTNRNGTFSIFIRIRITLKGMSSPDIYLSICGSPLGTS